MRPHPRTWLAGILLLSSCSVREDRAGCPCRLELDLSGFATRVSVALWEGPDSCMAQADGRFIRSVSKGIFDVSAWSGAGRLSGSRLTVPPGGRPDSLRVFRTRLDCTGETCTAVAVPRRQFARIVLKVVRDPGSSYPYSFHAESSYCGLDLRDLRPVRGRLAFPIRRTDEDTFAFDLLRQGPDTDVRIGVYEDAGRIDELPLHEWLRKAGYDWEAEDLSDMTICIDYAHRRFRLLIDGWLEGDIVVADI